MRTTGHQHLPKDIEAQKQRFHRAVTRIVLEHSIPLDLIINFDETGNLLIPLVAHTFAPKGVEKVVIQGSEEKRAETITVGVSAAGEKVPPQKICPNIRNRLGLPASQKVLLIIDVFAAHLTDAVKEKLKENNIILR
eukprot:gene5367-603_t